MQQGSGAEAVGGAGICGRALESDSIAGVVFFRTVFRKGRGIFDL